MCIACVLTWSLLGVKKSLSYARIGLFYGFNSKFSTSIPTPFICGPSKKIEQISEVVFSRKNEF